MKAPEGRLKTNIAILKNCEVNMHDPKLYEGMYLMKIRTMEIISELNRKICSK